METERHIAVLEREKSKDKVRAALLELGIVPPGRLNTERVCKILNRLGKDLDMLISLKALQILTKIYRHRNTAEKEYYSTVADAIRNAPETKKAEQILLFLQRLASVKHPLQQINISLLKEDPLREEIAGNQELISAILSACTKKECKYQALILLWLLSFSDKALRQLEKLPMFYMLSFVSKECREKELRVSLAIIRNYLMHTEKYNYGTLQKVEEVLSIASSRSNKEDPEEQADLRECRERYIQLTENVSTFDAYLEELASGSLQPFSYHFSAEFWRGNAEAIRGKRQEIAKALKRYLTSKDANNIWIASNDVYRMVEVNPESISIIRQLGIQQVLFNILTSVQSEDIRFHIMEALSVCYTKE